MSGKSIFSARRCLLRLLLPVLLFAALIPPADAGGLAEGLRKYEAGDYAGAISEWQPMADRGDADALFNLGQVYRLGRGVAVNPPLAEDYYRRAGDAGHAGAQGALATIYYYDYGTRPRRGQAITLWRQAAAAGDAPSQYILAVLHYNGQDVPKDLMQAYAWALLAAEGGLEEGRSAAQSMRGQISANQRAQARVLMGGLLVARPDPAPSPPVPSPIVPPVQVAAIPDQAAEPEVIPAPEPEPKPEAAPIAVTETEPEPVPEAEPEPVPVDAWSVQLGYYSQRDNAVRYWARVGPGIEALLPGAGSRIVSIDQGPERGIFYRLITGAFDRPVEARLFCNDLKAIGIDCTIVQP